MKETNSKQDVVTMYARKECSLTYTSCVKGLLVQRFMCASIIDDAIAHLYDNIWRCTLIKLPDISANIHAYIYKYTHACMHAYIHPYMHTYIRTYVHKYIHTHAHTYIHYIIRHTIIMNHYNSQVWSVPRYNHVGV